MSHEDELQSKVMPVFLAEAGVDTYEELLAIGGEGDDEHRSLMQVQPRYLGALALCRIPDAHVRLPGRSQG